MSTNVVMPQMGESVAEGTIVRWLKQVGDQVERDEPLFEISTDKVDTEVPSPIAGTLVEIRANEGDTIAVGTIVAVVGFVIQIPLNRAVRRTFADATQKHGILVETLGGLETIKSLGAEGRMLGRWEAIVGAFGVRLEIQIFGGKCVRVAAPQLVGLDEDAAEAKLTELGLDGDRGGGPFLRLPARALHESGDEQRHPADHRPIGRSVTRTRRKLCGGRLYIRDPRHPGPFVGPYRVYLARS